MEQLERWFKIISDILKIQDANGLLGIHKKHRHVTTYTYCGSPIINYWTTDTWTGINIYNKENKIISEYKNINSEETLNGILIDPYVPIFQYLTIDPMFKYIDEFRKLDSLEYIYAFDLMLNVDVSYIEKYVLGI